MIIDRLQNAGLYHGISSGIKKALEFLQRSDLEKLETGRVEIDGDDVFALVQQYETKPAEQSIWEAHEKYMDIQYIHSGAERIGYSSREGMKVVKEYDSNSDFLLLEGEGSFFEVKAGFFAVFAPEDAHMPCLAITTPEKVKKIIIKVAVSA